MKKSNFRHLIAFFPVFFSLHSFGVGLQDPKTICDSLNNDVQQLADEVLTYAKECPWWRSFDSECQTEYFYPSQAEEECTISEINEARFQIDVSYIYTSTNPELEHPEYIKLNFESVCLFVADNLSSWDCNFKYINANREARTFIETEQVSTILNKIENNVNQHY